jgi:transposase-like protein
MCKTLYYQGGKYGDNERSMDELLKEHKGPDDFYGPDGIMKQLSKDLIERAMQTELTEQIGYEKSESGEKPSGSQ